MDSTDTKEEVKESKIRKDALAQRMIRLGRRFGIVAIGGYVCDGVVRKGNWNDLDMWVRSYDLATAFLRELRDSGEYILRYGPHSHSYYKRTYPSIPGMADTFIHSFVNVTKPGSEYNFDRMDVVVCHRRTWTEIVIDLLASPTHPCNDFDINQLAWDGVTFEMYSDEKVCSTKECDQLIAKIKSGHATMLSIYPFFTRHFTDKRVASNRVRRLQAKGFVVEAPPEFLLPLPSLSSSSPLLPLQTSPLVLPHVSSLSSSPPPKPLDFQSSSSLPPFYTTGTISSSLHHKEQTKIV